jgi:PhnB protein
MKTRAKKAAKKAKPKAKAKTVAKPQVKTTGKVTRMAQPLMPHLVCAGAAKAIAFYKKAFGGVEMVRLPGKDGRLIHAAVVINGACVMLVDEFPEMGAKAPTTLKGTPVTIHLMVDDVDAFTKRAVKAGAKVVMPVADMFWGDRYGIVEDPFGHRWSIATHQRDMTVKEIQEAMKCMPM